MSKPAFATRESKRSPVVILGGGMTGLAAGWASGLPVYEAEEAPGGICSSYYIRPGTQERLSQPPPDDEAYRFEIGGGHWIFGGDPAVLRLIRKLAPAQLYQRKSSVFFPEQNLYVPYPLQNHLGYFNKELRSKALVEILTTPKGRFRTMADWMVQSFGATLTETFFGPFHEYYTAGLWKRIAPQDPYKSPIDAALVIRGASEATPPIGYNTSFLYPREGLNALAQGMAQGCDVRYGKRVAQIDLPSKTVFFQGGSSVEYKSLLSTLPLNKMMEMTGLGLEEVPDPHTAVLVLNIGGMRGERCPADHWLYLPGSRAGFHRVGFYSNVDVSFLPHSARASHQRVSIYVERAYLGGQKPAPEEIREYSQATVRELQQWGFLGEAEVVDPTWIDVAYTWSWPGSKWRAAALKALEGQDIQMVGRYARWTFQGIADSLRDGLYVRAANRLR
ncbi:MAG: FAD-dependent oxidoreductase [Terriglobia bacterium]